MTAKYEGELTGLAAAKAKAIVPAQQAYLAALAEAGKKAASANKADEGRAIAEEKEALAAGRAPDPVASPLLPRTLVTPRASLLHEVARVEREFTPRVQQAAAEYLRGLAFYEGKARTAGQAEVLKQIEAEKARVTAQSQEGAKLGQKTARDLVVNGDFARKNSDGTPEGWSSGDAGRGAVLTETGGNFLREVGGGKATTLFVQNVDRPEEAHELDISVRLRCKDLKGSGSYGIIIVQRDAQGGLVGSDFPCSLSTAAPAWKAVTGKVRLHAETKRLTIECRIVESTATVDFAGVRVAAR